MKSTKTRRYTVNNNLNATHNILNAILETDRSIHLVHMGTMGVYGYGVVPDTVVPEGYITVDITNQKNEQKSVEILHPTYPGSVYHMTKSQDAIFFQFFAKNYKLRITDLHQGIIWGAETAQTALHSNLVNRFDYDSDYGTVLNRFLMQAVSGAPLTVYGTGQQTRAFIHIENSMDCVELAINNPPTAGDRVKIFNQVTETHSLLSLVKVIREALPDTLATSIDNPRNELVSNALTVANKQFLDLGLKPIYVNKEQLTVLAEFIRTHMKIVNPDVILPMSFWR
jgi:UDP-sulfoquinovose synthase